MSDRQLRKKIITSFKFDGLSINQDACDYLVSQLLPLSNNEQQIWLARITEFLQKKKTLSDPVVQKHHVVTAVAECCKLETSSTDDVISVIDVFKVPHFFYNNDSKKFISSNENRSLFGSADFRIKLFQNRYLILKQRISRHELLNSGNEISSEQNCQTIKLHDIDYLQSRAGQRLKTIVFGYLSQLQEGKYFLEDPTGILPLDLSSAIYHTGLFCENCLILAEGTFFDGVLQVQGLAMPPPESSKISRTYFGNTDTFGGLSDTSQKFSSRFLKIEKEHEEAMIVFLADIWLDKPKVIEKLKLLFSGYNEYSPVAIVLMGNFLSKSYGSHHSHLLRDKFKELAEIISSYNHLLIDTQFIIVPGPTDSPFANILPRPSLPSFIVEDFVKKIPRSVFTTNPTRIQYCTQEICVFREDILTKMCRNCIQFPESGDISMHFVKTIVSQCYLIPVSLSVCPVYWSESWALMLYPLPDVLVIADQRSAFKLTSKDCLVFNPSSFSLRQYSFNVYIPATKQVEDSQITDNINDTE